MFLSMRYARLQRMDKKTLLILRSKAHHLKPVVRIGQHGLTEGVHHEVDVALDAHELVKIKLTGADKAQRLAMTEAICAKHRAILIATIGQVAVIYRENEADS